ncbi:hypothetical protein JMJ77_0009912, partial [Colletotrichum scovillei]
MTTFALALPEQHFRTTFLKISPSTADNIRVGCPSRDSRTR